MKDLNLKRNERSFLADQAADAKTAMTATLHDMKDTLTRVADVRSSAKQHPWLAVGSAVAAGFVTGAVLRPAQRMAVKTTGASADAESQPSCHSPESPPAKSLLYSTAVTVLAGILQTVVKNLIAAPAVAPDQPQVETLTPLDSTAEVEPNG